MSPGLAPIALFVFRRPDHTRRTIASLLANPEAERSEVVVFADGPRSERDLEAVEGTRAVVRAAGIPNLRLVERERNMGLARSVIAGVTELCDAHGSVIVLEDDLIVSPTFLRFMNGALARYRDDPRVFGVSGYMFPIEPLPGREALFLPFIGSWGWATWRRAWASLVGIDEADRAIGRSRARRRRFDLDGSYPYWEMLQGRRSGTVDSWAVQWYATVFLNDGLMLYPTSSLVTNVGFDGSGANCGAEAPAGGTARAADHVVTTYPPSLQVDAEGYRRVKRLLRRDTGAMRQLGRTVDGLLRRLGRALAPHGG